MAKRIACLCVSLACLPSSMVNAADGAEHHHAAGQPEWWIPLLFGLMTIGGAYLASRHFYIRDKSGRLSPAFTALQIFSVFLLLGTIVAQFWAHGDGASYGATLHHTLFTMWDYHITPHFVVNDVFMALFFGIAAKELAEAILKRDGTLRGKQAALPLIACVGGVIGPAAVYSLLCTPEMRNAWPVPCATDIAFAWLGARAIWGKQHPAVLFLLALAIGDDFVGMGLIAGLYPQHEFHASGIVLLLLGVGSAWMLKQLARYLRVCRHWMPYILAGVLCWFGLLFAGLHAALALVFVVPFMPMAGRDKGIFAPGESSHKYDTVNRFEHAFKPTVDVGLFFFGLANAGVAWLGEPTWTRDSWAVFLGLGLGKTVGITAFTILGYAVLKVFFGGAALPSNPETGVRMQWRDVPVVGILGAMGFTVALFVADAAGGAPSLKIGALASFLFLGLGVAVGKMICRPEPAASSEEFEAAPHSEVAELALQTED